MLRTKFHNKFIPRAAWEVSIYLILLGIISTKARGDIPAAFVDIGYGARPMGMGGAYVALASDSYGVLWNPACLPYVRGWQVSTMYAKQFGIIPYTLVTAAKGVGARHGLGAAVLSSGDNTLRETTGLFSYGIRLSSFGSSFKHWAVGFTLKVRTASFGNNPDGGEDQIRGSAVGYGLDIGIRWKFAPKWTFGALLRDVWNRVNYNNETRGNKYGEAVPAALIMGTAFLARPNLVFVLDWDKALYRDTQDKILAGFEWRLFKIIFLRGGWSQTLDAEPNRKFNWGLGLQYFRKSFGVRFDFAYQVHFLATTPRVSTSFWF
jgi:hypothetical protein